MKNIKKLITHSLCILLASVLFSCNHLEEGEVVGKHYEPYNEYIMMMPITISTGKTTSTMMIPYFIQDNEDFVLHVKGEYKGKERIEEVYVSKACYTQMQNGDRWYKTEDCSFSDNNNIETEQ